MTNISSLLFNLTLALSLILISAENQNDKSQVFLGPSSDLVATQISPNHTIIGPKDQPLPKVMTQMKQSNPPECQLFDGSAVSIMNFAWDLSWLGVDDTTKNTIYTQMDANTARGKAEYKFWYRCLDPNNNIFALESMKFPGWYLYISPSNSLGIWPVHDSYAASNNRYQWQYSSINIFDGERYAIQTQLINLGTGLPLCGNGGYNTQAVAGSGSWQSNNNCMNYIYFVVANDGWQTVLSRTNTNQPNGMPVSVTAQVGITNSDSTTIDVTAEIGTGFSIWSASLTYDWSKTSTKTYTKSVAESIQLTLPLGTFLVQQMSGNINNVYSISSNYWQIVQTA